MAASPPTNGIKMHKLQTDKNSPTVCPGFDSLDGIPRLANSYLNVFAMFTTTKNCQASPKAGISKSQTIPGGVVLDSGAHFFSKSCSATTKRISAGRANPNIRTNTSVGS